MPRSYRRPVLGGLVLLVIAVALGLAGAVRSWQLAVVQGAAAAMLVAELRMPDASLKRAAPLQHLLLAGCLVLIPVALGLVPMPMSILRWTSPGLASAFDGQSWAFLSMRPEATVGMLFTGTLALSVCVGAAMSSSMRGGRTAAEDAAVLGLGVLVVVTAAHAFSGTQALFGVLPLNDPPPRYFAPMVNPNHTATLLLMLLPVAVGRASMRRGHPSGRLAGTIAAVTLALLLYMGSGGATLGLAAMCIVGLVLLVPDRRIAVAAAVGVVALLGAGAWMWVNWVEPGWAEQSMDQRIRQYADLPALFQQYWLTGSGGGTYEHAYAPVRSIQRWSIYRHAHSEPQEWLVEVGVVGVVAVVLAWNVLPRVIERQRSVWWGLGLLGVAVHACVDFTLHIPGVLVLVAAGLGVFRGGFGRPRRANIAWIRRGLAALLVLQVGGALWWTRAAIVEHDVQLLEQVQEEPELARSAAGRVRWMAPWRSEWMLAEGWLSNETERAEWAGRVVDRHPDDATALRRAASLYISAGETELARPVLERALARNPSDYRTFVVYARLTRSTDAEASAQAWADAIVRWPWRAGVWGKPLTEGYDAFPIGLFWVDAIAEAPAPWHAALGQLLTSRGDHSAALLAYERAGAQRELYRWVPERALSLDGIGDSEGALAFLDEAATRDPRGVTYFLTRGTLMMKWGRPEEAVQVYLAGGAASPRAAVLSLRAVEAAAVVSPMHAIETAEHLATAGRLTPEAALVAGREALSLGLHRRCVGLLETSRAVAEGPEDEARTLWSQCASGCEDCAATPD